MWGFPAMLPYEGIKRKIDKRQAGITEIYIYMYIMHTFLGLPRDSRQIKTAS